MMVQMLVLQIAHQKQNLERIKIYENLKFPYPDGHHRTHSKHSQGLADNIRVTNRVIFWNNYARAYVNVFDKTPLKHRLKSI